MPGETNSCSYQLSASLEKGPSQQEPSCLPIIGPVNSFSIRLVTAPNFLLHLIKIADNVLAIIYVSPHNLLFTHWSNFCHWLFCSILYVICPRYDTICQFYNNPFNLFGQIKFSLPSKHCPLALPFPLAPFCSLPHLSSFLFHLYLPFLIDHVSLLSSYWFICLTSLTW